jgi:hypothetical protein
VTRAEHAAFLITGLLLGSTATFRAQGPVLDAGTFVISYRGTAIGRESFTLRSGRAGEPAGYTLSSSATYPRGATHVTLSPVVEWGSDSLPLQVQFDVFGDGQSRVYLRFGPRRVSLRIVRPGGESARELPAATRELVADDSVFALHALQPDRAASQAIFPRSGTRLPARLEDRGLDQTTLRGVAYRLRHLVLTLGPQERHLWYDERGRLMRVDIPALELTAERSPATP